MPQIIFFDIEADKIPPDIGAVSDNNIEFHDSSKSTFTAFIQSAEYLCGHNIFEHDLKFVKDAVLQSHVRKFIDTLYLSPLLFPSRPYHKIGKQYKIISEEEQNNPLLDAKLARDLFYDEVSAFNKLDERLKSVFYALLCDNREFKVCVLAETNDEAATIAGLLTKSGISARLIQDSAGFSMYNLAEIRFFVEALNLRDDVYTIDDIAWKAAKTALEQEYKESYAYEYANNLLTTFDEMNPKSKYKSSFLQFAHESKLEHFCTTQQSSQIIVSTIHKAKGREFDNVFLVLKQNTITDDKKRAVYVAMTRAKTNLYIHCTTNCFDGMRIEGVTKKIDETAYKEPKEIVLPVSYKGVHLSSFYYYKNDIASLKSGDKLSIKRESLVYPDGRKADKYFCYSKDGKKVIQFSDAMCIKIDEIIVKGYGPQAATVRLIIWWKKTDEGGNEYPK